MSDDAICLRCDWRGHTRGDTCPNCGVPLFRAEPRGEAAGRRRRLRRRRRPAAPPEPDPVPVAPAALPPRRSPRWQGRAILLVLAVGAAALYLAVRAATPPARTIPDDLTGRLIFATEAAAGGSRLYVWDLQRDQVRRGPRVDGVVEVVNAQRAAPGWLGLTLERPEGGHAAAILRFLGPDDAAVRLAEGDLVAWSETGDRFVTTDARPEGPGCLQDVRVTRYTVDPDSLGVVQYHRSTCERPIALARGSTQTYLTLSGPDGTRVVDTLGGAGRTVLQGQAVVGASFTGALLLVPAGPDADPPPSGPASIFLEVLLPEPIPYRAEGGPFVVERFLGWSHDAARAAVIGHTERARGLFILDATVANELQEPQPIRDLVDPDAVASSERFGWFVSDAGRLVLVRTDGSMTLLPLPEDVPTPAGPLVWAP